MDLRDEPERGNVFILDGKAYSRKLGLLKTTFKDPQLPKTTTWTFDFKYGGVNIVGWSCCLVLAS
jgi:hypothetical protein